MFYTIMDLDNIRYLGHSKKFIFSDIMLDLYRIMWT